MPTTLQPQIHEKPRRGGTSRGGGGARSGEEQQQQPGTRNPSNMGNQTMFAPPNAFAVPAPVPPGRVPPQPVLTPAGWPAAATHHHHQPGMAVLAPAPPDPGAMMSGYPHVVAPNTTATAPSQRKSTTSRARKSTTTNSKEAPEKSSTGGPVNPRRQKRLERNRESARLSRRRRKQYLEVLEERVTELSEEMDKGRREHVASAVDVLQEKRRGALERGDLRVLETTLARTGVEMRVAGTFLTQQVQSLSLPPQAKFLLWLSLQTDTYFRGGRAASERLSAARIGERMLCNGSDRVPPSQGMWPLFCNDVGLSFDQEERVRNFQKVVLQSPASWLHRHTAAASGRVLQSTHDAIQAVGQRIGQRERAVASVLTDTQRFQLLLWAEKNRDRISQWNQTKQAFRPQAPEEYAISKENHDAANLYIMNHRLQNVVKKLPPAPCLVGRPTLKRLARRASFESLGSSASSLVERGQRDEGRGLSREASFSSTGSLKRAASELGLDGDQPPDRPFSLSISPEEAEAAVKPTVDAALGFISPLLPPRPPPVHEPDEVTSSFKAPPPAPKADMTPVAAPLPPEYAPQTQDLLQIPLPHPGAPQPAPLPPEYAPPTQDLLQMDVSPLPHPGAPVLSNPAIVEDTAAAMPSFLPPHLNAVPEETLLQQASADGADDFLFELTEEDWAIGLDMDTTG